MKNLKEYGVISSWRDFEDVPLGILEDLALLKGAEATARALE